jgi:FkbM family methyltransferase
VLRSLWLGFWGRDGDGFDGGEGPFKLKADWALHSEAVRRMLTFAPESRKEIPENMWKSRALKFMHRLNALVTTAGLDKLPLVRQLRHKGRLLLPRLLGREGLLLAEVDGIPLYIYNSQHFSRVYFLEPFEPYTVRLFKAAIRPGATVLDIGANIGSFSLIAARQAGPQGKVFAFEPGPDNFKILKRNIRLNKCSNTVAIPKAVGDKSQVVTFSLAECPGVHSLFPPPHVPVLSTIKVDCITVDAFLNGESVDVIKMDIEGSEPYALEGMRQTVARSKALTLFVEMNPSSLSQAGFEPETLLAKLEGLGFDVKVIDEDSGSVSKATKAFLHDARDKPPGWFANLYCVKGGENHAAAESAGS